MAVLVEYIDSKGACGLLIPLHNGGSVSRTGSVLEINTIAGSVAFECDTASEVTTRYVMLRNALRARDGHVILKALSGWVPLPPEPEEVHDVA